MVYELSYIEGRLAYPKEKYKMLSAIAEKYEFDKYVKDTGLIDLYISEDFDGREDEIEHKLREFVGDAYKAGILMKGRIDAVSDEGTTYDEEYHIDNGKLDVLGFRQKIIHYASTEDLVAEIERRKEYKLDILLAPTYEIAKTIKEPLATVEAEYGEKVIEGRLITLAHHGPRSNNPAPCNTPYVPVLDHGGTILVSHLDLDTIGGILALKGQRDHKDSEFWEAAEFIDVNGVHHIHELPQEIQDKLNAFYAWNDAQPKIRYTELTNVTDQVKNNEEILEKILDHEHPEHEKVIQEGKRWVNEATKAVESCLYSETENVRAFITDGPFCSASYYSPGQDKVIPATVSFNEKYHSITIAFADGGGHDHSAREIAQSLWGPEAGGRDGIAGSPRGVEMTKEQFQDCIIKVDKLIEQNKELPVHNVTAILNKVKSSIEDANKHLDRNTDSIGNDDPIKDNERNKPKTQGRTTL